MDFVQNPNITKAIDTQDKRQTPFCSIIVQGDHLESLMSHHQALVQGLQGSSLCDHHGALQQSPAYQIKICASFIVKP